MINSGNTPPQDGHKYHAHHIFPQKFRKFFKSIGIDVDNPQFGVWVEEHEHLTNAKSYNKLWEDEIAKLMPLSGTARDTKFLEFVRGLTRLW